MSALVLMVGFAVSTMLSKAQDEQALSVNLPEKAPGQHAVTLKIDELPTA